MQSPSIETAIVAATIEVVSYALYIRDMRNGRARPSRASWLIWAPLGWLTLASQWQAGADLTLIKLTGMCIGITAVAAMATRYGTGGWSPLDRVCLLTMVLGVVAWLQTLEPVLALVFFIMADVAGALPTLRDALRDPDRDSRAAWTASLLASTLNLTVIAPEDWSASWAGFGIWGFNLYIVILNGLVVGMMARRQLRAAIARMLLLARLAI